MHRVFLRNRGRRVIIRDHFGRVHRGFVGRVDPRRGVFLDDGFGGFFIPFFLIATLFFL